MLEQTKSTLDFVLRLAFFASAPALLVFVAQVFPVTGAIVQIVLALVVFVLGEVARSLAERSRIASFVLSSQLEFEAYYRAHAPRPFLYYVFYPLLFPYWLFVPEARKEFLLYKGYTLVSFGLLVASLAYGYWSAFPPDLGLAEFWPIALGTFAAEMVVVLMFLMPIVTSVVHYHQTRAPLRLAALLFAAVISIGYAGARLARRRDPVVSYAARNRVQLRTAANPGGAVKAQTAALHAAWRAIPKDRDDVDVDGKIEGEALDVAHDALGAFYKNDEAHAFDVWYSRSTNARSAIVVVYFEARRGKAPIWLAMDRAGKIVRDTKLLPRGAFKAMKHAAE